jgi:hypothetical protein
MRYLVWLNLAIATAVISSAGLYHVDDLAGLLRDHGHREWVDAWLERLYWVSQVLLVAVAAVAALVAYRQVTSQRLIAILERTAHHNWEIFRDDDCKKAIEIMQNLNIPKEQDKRKLYWAARIVHLSHVLLIQQV